MQDASLLGAHAKGDDPEIRKLLQAHFDCQTSCYFETVAALSGSVTVVLGGPIDDPCWNYAFVRPEDFLDLDLREQIVRFFAGRGKPPVFASLAPLPGTHRVASEVWMAVRRDELQHRSESGLIVREIRTPEAIEAAVKVFEDGYTEAGEGIGYTDVSPAYVQLFRQELQTTPGRPEVQVLGYDGLRPVAIASACLVQKMAGIYNVAVVHEARGRGFGSAISAEVASRAFQAGADTCFLQTEPGTEVQTFYEKLGFRPLFELLFQTL